MLAKGLVSEFLCVDHAALVMKYEAKLSLTVNFGTFYEFSELQFISDTPQSPLGLDRVLVNRGNEIDCDCS